MITFRATAPIQRSKGGNAIRSAAYRSGKALEELRSGVVFDRWRSRKDVVYSELLLPPYCHRSLGDREMLWNRVEERERRRDAQLARDWLYPLQHHMPIEDNVELIRRYLSSQFVSQGMIADLNIHNPGVGARNGALHAHVMTTLRFVDAAGQFGVKCLDWYGPAYLRSEQKAWSNFVRSFIVEKAA